MIERSCRKLAEQDVLSAAHVEGRGVFPRGAAEVKAEPIVELGRAMAELIRGALAAPPAGMVWFYGTDSGRTTLPMRSP